MSCPDLDHLDDAALAAHLDACARCARAERADAHLADSLVAASAAARRFRRVRRRVAAGLLAASLLAAAVLAVQVARRPEPLPVFVLRGDETGVVLTGPDVARRAESLPQPPPRKGDRT